MAPTDISTTAKLTVIEISLRDLGYGICCVCSQNLCSGGAMVMHLDKVDIPTIKKLGCWSCNTFMIFYFRLVYYSLYI